MGCPNGAVVKNHLTNAGDIRDAGLIPGLGRSMKWKMVTHSCILAWKIPWTEEPDWLQSMGSPGVRYDEHLSSRAANSLFPKISPRMFLCHLHLVKTIYQRIVDLLWCVNFRCTALSIVYIYTHTHTYAYTHTHTHTYNILFQIVFPYKLLKNIE